jgi:NACalpha-BTF3-like transcription factor
VNKDIKRKTKKSKSTEKNKSNNLNIKDIEIVQDQMKKEEEDILLHLRATVILIDYIFEYF